MLDFTAFVQTLTNAFEQIVNLISRPDVAAFIQKMIVLIDKIA